MCLTRTASQVLLPVIGAGIGVLSLVTAAAAQAPAPAVMNAPVADARTSAVAANKAGLIRSLLRLTKAADRAVSTIEAAIPTQRNANPQIPAEFWDELLNRARADTARLVEMLVRVYDAQFTEDELEKLVGFYASPLGRHLIQAQPAILSQSALVGQRWGAQLSTQVVQELGRRNVQAPNR